MAVTSKHDELLVRLCNIRETEEHINLLRNIMPWNQEAFQHWGQRICSSRIRSGYISQVSQWYCREKCTRQNAGLQRTWKVLAHCRIQCLSGKIEPGWTPYQKDSIEQDPKDQPQIAHMLSKSLQARSKQEFKRR